MITREDIYYFYRDMMCIVILKIFILIKIFNSMQQPISRFATKINEKILYAKSKRNSLLQYLKLK